jgi:hypothetical protein
LFLLSDHQSIAWGDSSWAGPALSRILKISEAELFHGPTETDPQLSGQVSAAYTGLDLEIAEHVVTMGYTSWIASRPEDARRAILGVMPWLTTLQRRSPRAASSKHGQHLLARGHELLGALALDQLENDTAISHFRQALTLSEELGDAHLISAHMTQLGDGYRRKGDKTTALALMEQALAHAQQGDRATKGYVLQMLAYTYADTGDEADFERHIKEAVDLLGHSGEGYGVVTRDFIPFEVLEIYGKATRDFGRPVEAMAYLKQAEQALMSRPNVPRWRTVLMISTAQALCDAGELERGVEVGMQGLLMAHSCQSPRQMNRVRKLVKHLEAGPNPDAPALRPLRELVREVYAGDRSPLLWHPQHAM